MQTISTIQTTTMTMELRIKEIQETYNVLEEHSIKVCFQLETEKTENEEIF